ncbi:MAG TPA: hypothetical protein VN372_13830 [Methanospirillum sp.]|nr:hypothetical protein [Methanospirillum sp.]
MYTLAVFFVIIILISVIGFKFRVPPFMTLVGGAVAFGFAMGGVPEDVFEQVAMGCASVFNILGIPILAGSVIAKYLAEQGYIAEIVSDIRRIMKNPHALSGLAGYIIAVPSTCPITAYMILSPVLSHLAPFGRKRSALLYLVALGSTLGVAFVYPSPVTFPLFDSFAKLSISPFSYNLVAIPLSLFFLAILVIGFRRIKSDEGEPGVAIIDQVPIDGVVSALSEDDQHQPDQEKDTDQEGAVWGLEDQCNDKKADQSESEVCLSEQPCERRFHPKAWAPFIVIFAAIPIGLFLLHLSHFGLVQFIMFSGMIAAVATALPENRWTGFVSGAKHAGVIIFDICGAGALGYVITQSSFATDALSVLAYTLPLILIPFVLSALIQTAQGSRIVTSVLTAQIIAQTGIPEMMNPLALFLMIIAGAGIICFVTDPYFWMLHRTTGDDVKTVFRNYTVPQIFIGCATYLVAFTIQWFWP